MFVEILMTAMVYSKDFAHAILATSEAEALIHMHTIFIACCTSDSHVIFPPFLALQHFTFFTIWASSIIL
jgi:hypothetical protein